MKTKFNLGDKVYYVKSVTHLFNTEEEFQIFEFKIGNIVIHHDGIAYSSDLMRRHISEELIADTPEEAKKVYLEYVNKQLKKLKCYRKTSRFEIDPMIVPVSPNQNFFEQLGELGEDSHETKNNASGIGNNSEAN